MSEYIPDIIRSFVIFRANHKCEYCLIPEEDSFHTLQVDHIISLKHNGETIKSNLALSCPFCNRNKGSDVGSFLFKYNEFARFYNPRQDKWEHHFYLKDGVILAKTKIGEATIKILKFNDPELLEERKILIQLGRFSI